MKYFSLGSQRSDRYKSKIYRFHQSSCRNKFRSDFSFPGKCLISVSRCSFLLHIAVYNLHPTSKPKVETTVGGPTPIQTPDEITENTQKLELEPEDYAFISYIENRITLNGKLPFNLITIDGNQHVIVDADEMQTAQAMTTRLHICLVESNIKNTPLGRHHLLVPGMTKEKLQSIVDEFFNPDVIEVYETNDYSKLL